MLSRKSDVVPGFTIIPKCSSEFNSIVAPQHRGKDSGSDDYKLLQELLLEFNWTALISID